ncbi:hypothetical protein [Shewanella litorisediminis]|uniref:DUF3261 domain-containing protein n=1 Tax=Shewanella litorisediminis TaxID=1173586 RepID=A0ABX7G0I4_9GAMM|nr:hypothetical protein [Shewanella litorisediminis]MCL2918159.1 hypothetical protein [Shewanella litorisediminis]QRH00785.1 hypothetical protein JQC75_12970 [Shewanella litorisediminis]
MRALHAAFKWMFVCLLLSIGSWAAAGCASESVSVGVNSGMLTAGANAEHPLTSMALHQSTDSAPMGYQTATSLSQVPMHLNLGKPASLHAWLQVNGDGSERLSSALSSGMQPSPLDNHVVNIPRGYRWQLLSAQWLRDFTPEYVLALELPLPEVPALLPRTDTEFPPQLDWPLTYHSGASLRPGGWKESNLRFRFLQSRDLSLPGMA